MELKTWRRASQSYPENCVELATWRKATRSNAGGACLELATWRKAVASHDIGACVELATFDDRVGVRDSKQPGAGHIELPDTARAALLSFVRTND